MSTETHFSLNRLRPLCKLSYIFMYITLYFPSDPVQYYYYYSLSWVGKRELGLSGFKVRNFLDKRKIKKEELR